MPNLLAVKGWATSPVVLAVWLLILVVISSCGTSAVPQNARAVPWINTPGADTQLAGSSSAQRPCGTPDIHFEIGPAGAYQGHATQELTVRNVATDACFVPAPPALEVVLDNGQHRSVASDSSLRVIGASNGQAGLASGQAAQLLIGTPATCATAGNPTLAKVVTLTLLTGQVMSVAGVSVDIECGSPTLLIFNVVPISVTTVPESALRATLTIPAAATPGQTFVYFVSLDNPSPQTIPLVPCPSYTQTFGITNVVRQTLLLNCVASGPIASGASTSFEMELQVPPGLAKGVTKLSWQLDVPAGAFVGSAVTVN